MVTRFNDETARPPVQRCRRLRGQRRLQRVSLLGPPRRCDKPRSPRFDQNFVVLGGIEFNFLHLKGLFFAGATAAVIFMSFPPQELDCKLNHKLKFSISNSKGAGLT